MSSLRPSVSTSECDRVRARYARREGVSDRYSPLAPDVLMAQQEKVRALARCFRRAGLLPLGDKRLLEIGCGHGGNLHQLLGLGFRPENLVGNELLEERIQSARHLLPVSLALHPGDATALDLPDASFDVVLQSTVFTSILDRTFQRKLAKRMWDWVKPGGGVLWYDFAFDNPRNPDVRGVPFQEIQALFPEGRISRQRITLAPPLARLVCPIHPALYTALNVVPFLRTHWLCWIHK